MFKGVRLQTRLFFSYSIFLLLLLLGLSIPIYTYLNNTITKNTNESIIQSVASISSNLDNFIDISETITKQVYYNDKLLKALDVLRYSVDETETGIAYKEINADIFLLTWLNSRLNRINIYNSKGNFFSDKLNDRIVSEVVQAKNTMNEAREKNGAAIVSYFSSDPWSSSGVDPVLSFSRQITYLARELGFLEVQVKLSDIIGNVSFYNIKNGQLYIFNQTEVLYPVNYIDGPDSKITHYKQAIAGNKQGEFDVSIGRLNEHIIYEYSDAARLFTVYVIPYTELYQSLRAFRNITIGAFMALLSVSLLIFYFLTRILTRPLRELRNTLADADILATGITIENSENNDELKSINDSFNLMRISLKKTMEEVVKTKTLQLKTHFDVLQAQISPHFLFNMLGIIAISCGKSGAGDAADMCRKLARFLRYCISTTQSVCKIKDEIQFAREYLELLKYRYSHRLEFEINVTDEILELTIPKLTLQPLVENCIVHGFRYMDGVMSIFITGVLQNSSWEITIEDNGCGISNEVVQDIQKKITNYSKTLDEEESAGNPSVGEMGIVNTFARLKLLYKNEIDFEIGNNVNRSGAFVKIRSNINSVSEGSSNE